MSAEEREYSNFSFTSLRGRGGEYYIYLSSPCSDVLYLDLYLVCGALIDFERCAQTIAFSLGQRSEQQLRTLSVQDTP